ncbi:MAG: hypothetical protein AMXMBFR7_16200 [Planctomycetota bacterium]
MRKLLSGARIFAEVRARSRAPSPLGQAALFRSKVAGLARPKPLKKPKALKSLKGLRRAGA